MHSVPGRGGVHCQLVQGFDPNEPTLHGSQPASAERGYDPTIASRRGLGAEGFGRTRDQRRHAAVRHSGSLIGMATVTRTFLVDDIDGSTEDVENVRLSLDGTKFEIDLSAVNAARLREKLAKFVEHGTRVTPQ